jgi:hypothetical protein
MRVQVTIPVTVVVDYDTDEISTANGEFLAQDTDEIGTINGEFLAEDTAKVVKGMILDLSECEPLVEALTDSTGWLVNGLSIHMDDAVKGAK